MQIKIAEEDAKWYIETAPKFGEKLSQCANLLASGTLQNPRALEEYFANAMHSLDLPSLQFPFTEQYNSLKEPFAKRLCISVNNCVAHGLYSNSFKDEDIITIDGGISAQAPTGRRMYFDSAITVVYNFDNLSKEDKNLSPIVLAPANAISDILSLRGNINTYQISEIIEEHASIYHYDIVNSLCGHSIGYQLHGDVLITNMTSEAAAINLLPGTFICPEPMYVDNGTGKAANSFIDPDGWSVIVDSLSSHWETTVYYDGNKLIDVVGIISS